MTDIEKAARAEADRRYPELVLAPENEQRAEDFIAGASWLAEYLLSDENVEKAARAMLEETYGVGEWKHREPLDDDLYRRRARAALSAVGKETP